ncbi:hypothetical protein HPB52_022162 [Rhipicephalus sanguineus]|uniref:Uncharacterized protein n=1 Tax=Rhipicephalus sanguineus TaxID=34632 RepID=A0A9D4T4Y1_RHISA|nr:hypothetical protein HPB52_022162 [Rhipicephalus sanguineus]
MTDSNAPFTEQASRLQALSDVLSNPSDTTPYQHLKTKVMERFMPSERVRLQQHLAEGDLGDRRLSQLLRRMRQLLGEHDRNIEPKACQLDRCDDGGVDTHLAR